jgi:hypothetical protein
MDRLIYLTQGKNTIVNDIDFLYLLNWNWLAVKIRKLAGVESYELQF